MVLTSCLSDLKGRMIEEDVKVDSTGGEKKEEQMSGGEHLVLTAKPQL